MAKSSPTTLLRAARRCAGRFAPARAEVLRRLERRLAKRQDRRLDKVERRLTKRLKRIERRIAWEGGSEPKVGRLDYPGAPIELLARTPQERFRLRATEKEPWTVEWLDGSIRPGECLYDIGANVGAYSLVAAMGSAQASVVAFEPGFASFATLCHNIAHNRVDDRVTPLPVALSDATELSTLAYCDLGSGHALHGLGEGGTEESAVFRQSLLTYRLDDLVERFGLRPPNHLKVDVDGSEAATLRGAERTLAGSGLRTVMVEVSTKDAEAIERLLARAGLERLRRTERRVKQGKRVNHWYELWARPSGTG